RLAPPALVFRSVPESDYPPPTLLRAGSLTRGLAGLRAGGVQSGNGGHAAPESADDGPVGEFDSEKQRDQLLLLLHLEANLWRGSLVSRPSLKRADSGDILYGMEIQ